MRAEFLKPVALTVDVSNRHVMQQVTEDRGREDLVARQDLQPVAHVFVRRERHRGAFLARRDESEQKIRLDTVEGTEADFVDNQQKAIEVAPHAQA